jgi:hypothetical protein
MMRGVNKRRVKYAPPVVLVLELAGFRLVRRAEYEVEAGSGNITAVNTQKKRNG